MSRSATKKKPSQGSVLYVETKIVGIQAKSVAGETADNTDIQAEWDIHIASFTDQEIVVDAKCKVCFIPAAFLELRCEYLVTYTHKGMTEEKFEENMDRYIRPCLAKNTMLMSELSNHINGSPLIVPPIIEQKKQGESK